MITPDEIKTTALKWWREVLQNDITQESFFPKSFNRIGKIKPRETINNFEQIQRSLSVLRQNSKERIGYGYDVIWNETNNQKIGRNPFPSRITIDSLADYLKLLKKEREFKVFKFWSLKILEEFPELKAWMLSSPEVVIEHGDEWTDLLKVCRYFKNNPKPNLFVRQLPIEVHTKFIEQKEAVIAALLEFIIPNDLNSNEKNFLQRYNLRYDEPIIRIRFLDSSRDFNGQADISLPISRFKKLSLNYSRVLIAENKMNFLALPDLVDTIAIWSGGGYYVRYLAGIDWLDGKEIYYWGDIDTHGFHILNQARSYYKQVKSIMMDFETLNKFKEYSCIGSPTNNLQLDFLDKEELELYSYLKQNNIRLEQEKISNSYANECLMNVINDTTK